MVAPIDWRATVRHAQRRPYVAALILLTLSCGALAQSAGVYDLSWSTLDNGGGRSTGGGFELSGTIAQSDAQNPASGGAYLVVPGFWPGVQQSTNDGLFADGFE